VLISLHSPRCNGLSVLITAVLISLYSSLFCSHLWSHRTHHCCTPLTVLTSLYAPHCTHLTHGAVTISTYSSHCAHVSPCSSLLYSSYCTHLTVRSSLDSSHWTRHPVLYSSLCDHLRLLNISLYSAHCTHLNALISLCPSHCTHPHCTTFNGTHLSVAFSLHYSSLYSSLDLCQHKRIVANRFGQNDLEHNDFG
jgi:hypothetical protein